MKKVAVVIVILALFLVFFYIKQYYPKMIMSEPCLVFVTDPQDSIYKNDVLHPCIRYVIDSQTFKQRYYMVQTPYYSFNDQIENPIFYHSNDFSSYQSGKVLAQTPKNGYNSDPCLFVEDSIIYTFWREARSAFCDSMNCTFLTKGVYTTDGTTFSEPVVYLKNEWKEGDYEQCPILIKRNGKYYFYAAWYQYKPERINKGICIWEGTSLAHPDFRIKDTIRIEPFYTVGRWHSVHLNGHSYYIPKPTKFDFWHFDLFEWKNNLYMICNSEWGDNILIAKSKDYVHFSFSKKPLVNRLALTNNDSKEFGLLYKPTGFVKNDSLYLYFTARNHNNARHNELWLSKGPMDVIDDLFN